MPYQTDQEKTGDQVQTEAENILNQQFKVYEPNKVWTSDLTYVPTDEGWLYLAGHKDLFTSEIVGYSMGARMTKNLIS